MVTVGRWGVVALRNRPAATSGGVPELARGLGDAAQIPVGGTTIFWRRSATLGTMAFATVIVSPLLAVPAALLLYAVALVAGVFAPRLVRRRRHREEAHDDDAQAG
jgi:hypothetical protein